MVNNISMLSLPKVSYVPGPKSSGPPSGFGKNFGTPSWTLKEFWSSFSTPKKTGPPFDYAKKIWSPHKQPAPASRQKW